MSLFFGSQEHQKIALASLAGFAEDLDAAKLFERRFQPLILSGVATMFVGFGVFGYLAFRAQQRGQSSSVANFTLLALVSFVIGFGFVVAGCRRMGEATPISPQSG